MLTPADLILFILFQKNGLESTPRPTPAAHSTPTPTSYPKSNQPLWFGASEAWDRVPAGDVKWAVCIVHHESWYAGTYKAENPISSASGVGQWVDKTWVAHAGYAGVHITSSHASNNSPATQDAVFIWDAAHGRYAWAEC